jgi:hypothetical protein
MDQNEDTPPAIPPARDPAEAAATPPVGPIAAEPGAESKIELKSIDSPPMAPEMSDMVAAVSGPDAPKAEPVERPVPRLAATEKIEEIIPERPSATPPRPRDIVPFAAPAQERASRRFGTFALLAAAVVLAAAFGATAGVLATTGLTRLAGEPAPAAPTPAAAPPMPQITQTALTQLRSEVAALKASVEATNRSSGTQYTKLVERFDRLERAQSAGGKSDAALPKEAAKEPAKETAKDTARETTGSVTLPSTAATAQPLAPVPAPLTGIVPGWAVRDVYRGVAMLQSRLGGMVEVEPGDVLPGLGRIEAIRRQDGRWVVVTSKGTITSMR